MKKKITLFNESGTERWNLNLEKIENTELWGITDDTRYSLFPTSAENHHCLAIGNTPGEALDNFLKIEKELIEGL